MRKAGAKDYLEYSKKIIKITKKPISCEVFADDMKKMIIQGKNWQLGKECLCKSSSY